MQNKIRISRISKKTSAQKGFDERGCFGCRCKDSCCRFGADFDKEAYDLVILNRGLIEPFVNKKIEECFEKKWGDDTEFLGNGCIRSINGDNGFCIFHNPRGKGCILFKLVNEKKIDRKIVPSICRLFPLSWHKGELIVCFEHDEALIPEDCNCLESENTTSKSILETQKSAIDDIFEIDVN